MQNVRKQEIDFVEILQIVVVDLLSV